MSSTDPNARPRFAIVLDALPGPSPAHVRLRMLLKCLLRAWRFRCVSVREVVDGDRPAGLESKEAPCG